MEFYTDFDLEDMWREYKKRRLPESPKPGSLLKNNPNQIKCNSNHKKNQEGGMNGK